MKLEYLTLTNFRQYFERQKLVFAREDDKRVTVIHGVNGAGKTSIFLALNWCLYGRDAEGVRVIDNVGGLISKEAIQRAAVGARVETAVELVFTHEGYRYLVRRSLEGKRQADGTCAITDIEGLVMQRTEPTGSTSKVNNPIGLMNSILPVNVREYFLFDGEKIDNFAKPEASPEVRKAIDLVLRLEQLDRGRRHLDSVAQDYRRELKNTSSGELRDLLEKDEQARAEKDAKEARVQELTAEIASAKAKIAEIGDSLRNSSEATLLQQQRDRLNEELARRRTQLQANVTMIRDLTTSAYFVIAEPAITKALAILDAKRERGEVPSSIRQQFVQDLLDRMVCICGRCVGEGAPEHERLLRLLESSVPGSLEDDVLETSSSLRTLKQRIPDRRADLDRLMQERAANQEAIEALSGQIDDIGRQLKGLPLEEIGRLEKKREEYQSNVDSYNLQIGELKDQIRRLTDTIAALEKEIAKAEKAVKKHQLLSTKLTIAQEAADAMGHIHDVFSEDVRTRIEAKTKEIFHKLAWKGEGHFADVRLGRDFNLEVIDRYGQPARPELSAGERQVLSLSFITAMSRVSENEAPLVMDTPFGRLSSQHRAAITEHLPELADQLVLFVTDEELRGEARANLEPRIGAEYQLAFNAGTGCTTIEEL